MNKRYTLEKVLYLASERLHVGHHEARGNTTLHNLTKQAAASGLIVPIERPSEQRDGDHYQLTASGRVVLNGLQLTYRLQHHKDTADAVARLEHSLHALNDPDVIAGMQALLATAQTGKLNTKVYRKSTEFNKAANNLVMSMGAIDLQTPVEKRTLTPLGEILSKAVNGVDIAPTVSHRVPAMEDAVQPPALSFVDKEQRMRVLATLFREGFHAEYNDDSTKSDVPFAVLVDEALCAKVAEDDAGAYYKLTHAGKTLMREVEMTHLQNMGMPIDQLLSDGFSCLPAPFDPKLSLADYRQQGLALAREHLGPDALEGVNELHWDECHLNQMPIEEAVQVLTANKASLLDNRPSVHRAHYAAIESATTEYAQKIGGGSNLVDHLPAIHEHVEARLQQPVNRALIEHVVRGHQQEGVPITPPTPAATERSIR
jgi:hypothetical protein